ncbi:hypothetical protein EMEDMD4_440087 [Sinorhizobium medicae]|uniref:Uncharacterized protein n=1 Tax=Sinorhizobium medicae TaxID=110321 RepID=A0A508X4P9_9HYPH|nr:hypothetical protein EMEDMD4_440087 [Sinorhizobium medicae]
MGVIGYLLHALCRRNHGLFAFGGRFEAPGCGVPDTERPRAGRRWLGVLNLIGSGRRSEPIECRAPWEEVQRFDKEENKSFSLR